LRDYVQQMVNRYPAAVFADPVVNVWYVNFPFAFKVMNALFQVRDFAPAVAYFSGQYVFPYSKSKHDFTFLVCGLNIVVDVVRMAAFGRQREPARHPFCGFLKRFLMLERVLVARTPDRVPRVALVRLAPQNAVIG